MTARRLVLITGLSGAGKSVALKSLEDTGFEAIDNIPLSFLSAVASAKDNARPLVVGADIRSRDFSHAHFVEEVEKLRANPEIELSIIYLDCDDETLRRRFTETRRRHPLADDRPVTDGIRHERELVSPLRDIADLVIDTSDTGAQELRRLVLAHFATLPRTLAVAVTSFSFKRGLPREADLVFDVRFLKNPHYDDTLRDFTGMDARVGNYIKQDPAFAPFFERLCGFVTPLLPRYAEEGKQYLTIAIGCTGGKHRSVFTTEQLSAYLTQAGYAVITRHRDMEQA